MKAFMAELKKGEIIGEIASAGFTQNLQRGRNQLDFITYQDSKKA